MKRYTVKVECRGCQNEIVLGFDAPKVFCDRSFEAQCNKCKSDVLIEVRQPMTKKQLMTRVKLVKHTDKLLRILKRRELAAKMKKFAARAMGAFDA